MFPLLGQESLAVFRINVLLPHRVSFNLSKKLIERGLSFSTLPSFWHLSPTSESGEIIVILDSLGTVDMAVSQKTCES